VINPVAVITLPSDALRVNQPPLLGGVDEAAGTLTCPPLTVTVWADDCSMICTVLDTPGKGSTPPNAAVPTTMVTVVSPGAGVNVTGELHASGLGAPGFTPLHGPVSIATAQVDATCPYRSVIDPVAIITLPSGALRVNQTGEVVWECPLAGTMKRDRTTSMAVESLCIRSAFSELLY